MIEKIKTRPINRKKLIRRTIITVVMAVIFGTVACVTFLVLEPVISNRLYPEEKPQPQPVIFPEDQEEMSPEEMLAENIPSASPSPSPTPDPDGSGSEDLPAEESPSPEPLTEERLREILSDKKSDQEDYAQVYKALQDLVSKGSYNEDGSVYKPALSQYMVTIRGVTSNVDWFDDIQESSNQASGIIVADNGVELLILVKFSALEKSENLVLVLGEEEYRVNAQLKGIDKDTNFAIVAVERSAIPEKYLATEGLAVASLGFSTGRLAGTPVIALGSPMGINNSVGYGMITSAEFQITGPDRSYNVLLTDISGSKNAEGVLFNLNGQVIGIITENKLENGTENMITAYGITDMKRIIEKLSNGSPFAYMGITGIDVTQYVHTELGVPFGVYVTNVQMESPAMLAGIQAGDIITAMNGVNISSYGNYCSQLMQLEPEQTVQLAVERPSQGAYREMVFSIQLGGN